MPKVKANKHNKYNSTIKFMGVFYKHGFVTSYFFSTQLATRHYLLRNTSATDY